jgi:8-hydroxy-5-deazaflavin:NADPH oxidoreductase
MIIEMRIGIIGAGNIGGTLARRLAAGGHGIVVANRRGPDAIAELLAEIGPHGRFGDAEDAAGFGEVVIVATPLAAWSELPAAALGGKVVVDANNFYPGRDGPIEELADGTLGSSELFASRLAGARVVKAFNTIFWERLRDAGRPPGDPGRLAIPLAADDAAAKAVVAGLIDELGFDAVDNGKLADGINQQPGTPVYNNPVGEAAARELLRR